MSNIFARFNRADRLLPLLKPPVLKKKASFRSIEIVRKLSFLVVPACFLLSIILFFLGDFLRAGIGLGAALLFSLPLLLLKKRRFGAAKWAFFVQFLVLSFILPFVFGVNVRTEWFIILAPSLSFLLFDWRNHAPYLATGVIGYLIIIGIYHFHQPWLRSEYPEMFQFWLATIISVFLYLLMVIFRDETIRSEEIISQQNNELRVAKIELEARNITLQSLNQDLQTFAHRASHDMKEPLRTINSFSTLLSRKLADQPDKQELLSFIEDGSCRMSQMLDDLLAFARTGAENMPLQPVDLGEIVENIRRSFRLQLQEKGGRIEAEPLPIVNGHPTLLTQLFQNLIGNGLKYSRKEVPPEVLIRFSKKGAVLHFEFEDNGIGIESDYLQKIFEPFVRLHGRTEFEGSGIGLATCLKIVDLYGGKIWAESEPGRGTCMIIECPCSIN